MSLDNEQEHLQHAAEHEKPGGKSHVLIYLVILFAAAFLLMLFSYLMQQRQNSQNISDLSKSVSAAQTLDQLIQEKDRLEEEVGQLKEQVAELEVQAAELSKENDGLKTLTDSLTRQLEKTQQAMDYFWQLDEAYVRGRYSLCRDLIQSMEDLSHGSPLKDYLPQESATDTDRFSPAQRYQEIYDALF